MNALRILLIAVGLLTAVAVTPAQADLLLKLEGIPGDSSASGHVNEIDASSVQFGASQTGIREAGGKASPRRSSLSTLVITKRTDKASPKLFLACATGQHIQTAVLTFRDLVTGAPPYEYLTITLTDVFISGYSVSSGGDYPSEAISISFSKIEYKYVGKQPNGALLPPVIVTFDVLKNKELALPPQ